MKRQREQAKRERQQVKAAKREQRKNEKGSGESGPPIVADDFSDQP
ncbi:MAG TPA: hypothetical protein VJZ00_00650 [Thermoanaerobaculia bacterium]|nr:hypothetical protein [Thermoanaerobaculia bacterium]